MFSGVPDSPIETQGPVVTTYITYLTPTASRPQQTRYPTIVVGGKTITLIPDPEFTESPGDNDWDALPPAATVTKRAATPTTLATGQYWIRA